MLNMEVFQCYVNGAFTIPALTDNIDVEVSDGAKLPKGYNRVSSGQCHGLK
jgi:hypothetical protein